jgi:hypothetical protein
MSELRCSRLHSRRLRSTLSRVRHEPEPKAPAATNARASRRPSSDAYEDSPLRTDGAQSRHDLPREGSSDLASKAVCPKARPCTRRGGNPCRRRLVQAAAAVDGNRPAPLSGMRRKPYRPKAFGPAGACTAGGCMIIPLANDLSCQLPSRAAARRCAQQPVSRISAALLPIVGHRTRPEPGWIEARHTASLRNWPCPSVLTSALRPRYLGPPRRSCP